MTLFAGYLLGQRRFGEDNQCVIVVRDGGDPVFEIVRGYWDTGDPNVITLQAVNPDKAFEVSRNSGSQTISVPAMSAPLKIEVEKMSLFKTPKIRWYLEGGTKPDYEPIPGEIDLKRSRFAVISEDGTGDRDVMRIAENFKVIELEVWFP